MSLRVFVFGKNGQLAQGLHETLTNKGHSVFCAGRQDIDLSSKANIHSALQAFQPDWVINAAAYTGVDLAQSEPNEAFALNCSAPRYMAQACAELGLPFIHLSSDYVFDGQKITPYIETDLPAPLGVYGQTKSDGERAVLENHTNSYILRTSWVCSKTGKNFLKTMMTLLQERERVNVVEDQFGAPTFVDDLVAAIEAIFANPNAPFGLYHFSCAGETSWFGFAQAIADYLKIKGFKGGQVYPIQSKDYPTAAPRPKNSRLDCSHFEKTFSFKRRHWQESLQACMDQMLDRS